MSSGTSRSGTRLKHLASLPVLDAIRGIAALEVVLTHSLHASFVDFSDLPTDERTPLVAAFYGLLRLGHDAVLVFFVLSGFLVGGQIVKSVQDGRFRIRKYAVDRASRILLPLVPAVVISALLAMHSDPAWLLEATSAIVGLNGVVAPTLSNNWPLWSIAYEIWFYIAAGSIAALIMQERFLLPALLICLSAALFSILDGRYCFYWAIGALAATLPKRFSSITILGLAAFASGLLLRELPVMHALKQPVIALEAAESIFACGFALILPWAASASLNARARPIAGTASVVSAASYTMYLTHAPVLVAIGGMRSGSIGSYTLGLMGLRLIAIFVVTAIFYMAFERHTPRLRALLQKTDPQANGKTCSSGGAMPDCQDSE